ncbi:hypothetical protein LSAT2_005358 [Lamellibrachia satsuma]|nr:hypothetical protein LSAT2_005358 [Lamellibrachia satsuma]
MANATVGYGNYSVYDPTTTTTVSTTTIFTPTPVPTSSTTEALIPILGNKYTVLIVLTMTLVPACCLVLCCLKAFVASRLRRTHPLIETKKPRRRAMNHHQGGPRGPRPALTKSFVNTWSVATG